MYPASRSRGEAGVVGWVAVSGDGAGDGVGLGVGLGAEQFEPDQPGEHVQRQLPVVPPIVPPLMQ